MRSSPVTNSMNPTIQEAREFALTAHGAQQYGDHPYSYHLDAVVDLLEPYGEQAQIAGYLHDTVEDTPTEPGEIIARFGSEVAEAVSLVSDEPGETRSERKTKTHAKLAATTNSLALIVKAADRLANLLESSKDAANGKLQMYREENPAFRAAAYRPGLCDGLWFRIDEIIG